MSAMAELDAGLPPRFRGTGRGYQRMLEAVSLRVSVTGIRGKSTVARLVAHGLAPAGRVVAKITGDRPVMLAAGQEHPIARNGPVLLDETIREIKRHFPMDALVVENQAITPYTMRVVHEDLVRPHAVLVTNIRRDHQSTLGNQDAIIRAILASIPRDATVWLGEPDPGTAKRFIDAADQAGIRVHHAPPDDDLPGMENISLASAFLESLGLELDEQEERKQAVRRGLRWKRTPRGHKWYPAAQVNDIDSTQRIMDHLGDAPIHYVAYLRSDRRGRTAAFAKWLDTEFEAGRAARSYLAGPGCGPALRYLRKRGHPVQKVRDHPQAARALAHHLDRTTTFGRIVTLANGAKPWPRAFHDALEPLDMRPIKTPAPELGAPIQAAA